MTRPGPDGMPPQGQDFGEFLRHALHAAADQVEPRPDGLERIRARVRSGPAYASQHNGAPGAAAGGFLAGLVRRWNAGRGGQKAAAGTALNGPAPHGSGTGGSSGGHGTRAGHARRQPRDWRDGLLRPTLAIACALFAIGVALAVPPMRQALVQLSQSAGITSRSTAGTPSQAGRRARRVRHRPAWPRRASQ